MSGKLRPYQNVNFKTLVQLNWLRDQFILNPVTRLTCSESKPSMQVNQKGKTPWGLNQAQKERLNQQGNQIDVNGIIKRLPVIRNRLSLINIKKVIDEGW